ncbi:MAG: TrkA family potassium uptake protein [Halobacteriales archaeon]|nr:TrkA family potassium uptake protein [Halobacteriales archaeon]
MRFVIVGAGRVGLRTASVVADADHEVTLVETDPEKVERAEKRGFTVVAGDGSREDTLLEAGVEDADGIGALTGDLNTNFAACMIAKHHGCRTVMRIDEDYREDIYRKYADEVDELIYPERLGAIAAKNALLGGNVRAIADVAANLQVLALTVTPDSPMRGYTIGELELPGDAAVLAFGKADEPMGLPLEDDSLEAGDQLAVLADFEVLEDVHRIIVGSANLQLAGGT